MTIVADDPSSESYGELGERRVNIEEVCSLQVIACEFAKVDFVEDYCSRMIDLVKSCCECQYNSERESNSPRCIWSLRLGKDSFVRALCCISIRGFYKRVTCARLTLMVPSTSNPGFEGVEGVDFLPRLRRSGALMTFAAAQHGKQNLQQPLRVDAVLVKV